MNILAFMKRIIAAIIAFFKNLGDNGVFAIWLGLLFFAAALIWGLSAAPRAKKVVFAANKILEDIGDARRLEKPLSTWGISGSAAQAGSWFYTTDNNLAVIWTLPVDGIFAPFLTLFTSDHEIEKTVPLTKTASVFAQRLPDGIPELWLQRVGQAVQFISSSR